MYLEIIRDVAFYRVLFEIDQDLAEETRRKGCPFCGGPLHYAKYPRVGRGGPDGLPDELRQRLGLCCGRPGCRKRVLPPSCLFHGRRWHWGAVVLVATTLLQQRTSGWNVDRLTGKLGISASRATLVRWLRYFRESFPTSAWWQRLRGRVGAEVGDPGLPGSLVARFEQATGDPARGLVACLRFLALGSLPPLGRHA